MSYGYNKKRGKRAVRERKKKNRQLIARYGEGIVFLHRAARERVIQGVEARG